MQKADLIKLVVGALVLVCAGAWMFLRSDTDPEDYVTAQPGVQEVAGSEETAAADAPERGKKKKKKKREPVARVGEDIG